jgi:hypothetical protein
MGAESPTLSAPKHHPRDRAADHIGGYSRIYQRIVGHAA